MLADQGKNETKVKKKMKKKLIQRQQHKQKYKKRHKDQHSCPMILALRLPVGFRLLFCDNHSVLTFISRSYEAMEVCSKNKKIAVVVNLLL